MACEFGVAEALASMMAASASNAGGSVALINTGVMVNISTDGSSGIIFSHSQIRTPGTAPSSAPCGCVGTLPLPPARSLLMTMPAGRLSGQLRPSHFETRLATVTVSHALFQCAQYPIWQLVSSQSAVKRCKNVVR